MRLYVAVLLAGIVAAGQLFFRGLPPAAGPGAAAATTAVLPVAAPVPALTPLTPGTDMDGFPMPGPGAQSVVFMRNGRIWLMGAKGEHPRALTGVDHTWDIMPVWSPRGDQIAFIRYYTAGKREGQSELWLMRADGSRGRALHREDTAIGGLAWDPRGTALAFTTPRLIRVFDLGTKAVHTVLDAGPEADLSPGGIAWSPDGQTLVYGAGQRRQSRAAPLALELFELPSAGGLPRSLTTEGGIMPAFSPDGGRLAFRNPRGQSGLYVLDLGTREIKAWVLDVGLNLYFHPSWSADGRRLFFSRMTLPGGNRERPVTSAILVSG